MSVLIGSARHGDKKDKNGKYTYTDGVAGDTCDEVSTQNWYPHEKGWYLVRPKSEEHAAAIAYDMEEACKNPNIGYDQSQNTTLYNVAKKHGFDCSKVTEPCETDCARLVRVCVLYAGIDAPDFNTATLKNELKDTGYFDIHAEDEYCKYYNKLRRGDILVTRTQGHAVVVLTNGEDEPSDYATTQGEGGGNPQDIDELLQYIGSLYQTEVTKADAVIREVGYINALNQPSIQPSNITLSVINYTNLLGNLFTMYIPNNVASMNTNVSMDVDGMENTTAKAIMRYLLTNGPSIKLNEAAVVGITANIYHESLFDAGSLGDYKNGSPTSFGLCQWHNTRGTAMKKHANPNWANNVSGQMSYLLKELEDDTECPGCLSALKDVPNTLEGAKRAADIFVRKFEMPLNVDAESKQRQTTAGEYWGKVVLQQV